MLPQLPPPQLLPPVLATARPVPYRPSSPPPVIVPHPSSDAALVLARRTRPRAPHPSSDAAPISAPPVLVPACPHFPTALVSARPRPARQCVSRCY